MEVPTPEHTDSGVLAKFIDEGDRVVVPAFVQRADGLPAVLEDVEELGVIVFVSLCLSTRAENVLFELRLFVFLDSSDLDVDGFMKCDPINEISFGYSLQLRSKL